MPYAHPKSTTNAGDFELLTALKQHGIPTDAMELTIAIRDRLKGVIEPEETHEMGSDGESSDLEVSFKGERYIISVSKLGADEGEYI